MKVLIDYPDPDSEQKVLGLVQCPAEEKPKAARMALLASRFNTMLSIPMSYAMVAVHLR